MRETHQFVYLFPSNSLNAFCHTIQTEHPDSSSVANSADGGTKALLLCSLLLPQLSYKSAGKEALPQVRASQQLCLHLFINKARGGTHLYLYEHDKQSFFLSKLH